MTCLDDHIRHLWLSRNLTPDLPVFTTKPSFRSHSQIFSNFWLQTGLKAHWDEWKGLHPTLVAELFPCGWCLLVSNPTCYGLFFDVTINEKIFPRKALKRVICSSGTVNWRQVSTWQCSALALETEAGALRTILLSRKYMKTEYITMPGNKTNAIASLCLWEMPPWNIRTHSSL